MSTMQVASAALWAALSAVVGFITDSTGIKVIRGDRAATDKKTVFLPRLPEGMLSFREVVKTIGFVYHECGHILKSDFALKYSGPLHQAIAGVLEDIRIEKFAMLTFPAARKYLTDLVRIMTEEGAERGAGFPPLSEDLSDAKVLQWYMLYRLRHDLLRQPGIKPAMESAVEVATKRFPQGMMVRLDAMMFEVDRCDSEKEVFELATEIMKMIKEESEKEPPPPPPPPQGDPQKNPQQQQSGNSSGTGQEDADDGGATQPGGQAGTGDDDQATGTQPGRGAGGTTAGLDQLLNMGNDEIIESVGDMLQSELNDMAVQKAGTGATMPNVHPLKLMPGPVDMAALKGAVNATRTRTLSWLSSAAQCDLRRDKRGILIDATQLAMAAVGGDIFAEEDEGIDINAAVSITIDRSGSMSGCIQAAASAALATALAYDVPGIETQVSVFPVYGRVNGSSDEGVGVIKRWGEKSRVLAERIGSLGVDGGTPMAEAVMFAASDLLRRQETLKLSIVVTDGQPDDLLATQAAVEAARAAGIVVTGIGIGVDVSAVFGEKFSGTLYDIGELSGTMTRLIKAAMSTKQ